MGLRDESRGVETCSTPRAFSLSIEIDMPSPPPSHTQQSLPSDGHEPTLDLIQRVRDGDEEAWESIDDRYRKALLALARGSMRGDMRRRLDSEDLVQSTFLAAVNGLDKFEHKGPGSLKAWLKQILTYRIQEKLRHNFADKRDIRKHTDVAALDSQLDDASLSPGDAVLFAEEQARYIDAIAELPENERVVLIATKIEGESVAALAARLSLTESTVRRRRAHAIAMVEKKTQ